VINDPLFTVPWRHRKPYPRPRVTSVLPLPAAGPTNARLSFIIIIIIIIVRGFGDAR